MAFYRYLPAIEPKSPESQGPLTFTSCGVKIPWEFEVLAFQVAALGGIF